MNYLLEIKAFYDLQEINQLSSGQIALWSALMHINNKVGWMQEFTVPNQTLRSKSGLSRNGVNQARNVLKQKGYINFIKSNHRKATKYSMLSLIKSSQDSVQQCGHTYGYAYSRNSGQEHGHDCGPLKKQDRTKQNNIKESSNKNPYEDYTQNSELMAALNAFEDMRRQSKKPLTDYARDQMLKKLDTLAADVNDKERFKIEALNESISQCWQRVFAPQDFQDTAYAFSQGDFDLEDHPTLLQPGMHVEDLI